MDHSQTFELHTKGPEAWNTWASGLLAARKRLEDSGRWEESYGHPANAETRNWLESARAIFYPAELSDRLNFRNYIFPGKVEFLGAGDHENRAPANFSSAVNFSGARFCQGLSLNRAIFEHRAIFTGAEFDFAAIFSSSKFLSQVSFEQVKFKHWAKFDKVEFRELAYFAGSKVQNAANFEKAAFKGRADFEGCQFAAEARFWDVVFCNETSFRSARFKKTSLFDRAIFKDHANFSASAFDGSSIFSAVRAEKSFRLDRANFGELPDFILSNFAEAPRLDNIRVIERQPTLPEIREYFYATNKRAVEAGRDRAARYRALKKLAIQGHDHEREQKFFAGEIRSRRWVEDLPIPLRKDSGVTRFWVGLIYQVLSDFGRSIARPVLWWSATTIMFSFIYLGIHLRGLYDAVIGIGAISEATIFSAGTILQKIGAFSTLPMTKDWIESLDAPMSCVAGPGNPIASAIALSLRKGLLFFGLDSTDKLNQIYACLYGLHPKSKIEANSLPDQFSPVIPDIVGFLGLLQLLISAILVFLFLLAVRNSFRIR